MGSFAVVSSLLKVAAVLALLVLCLRMLAKYQGARSGSRGAGRVRPPAVIEVLDQSRMGRTANVVAVRVGRRVLLLGMTETSIETLADITDDIDLTAVDDDGETDHVVESSVLDHAVDLLRSGGFRR